jgi:hypothetical protein
VSATVATRFLTELKAILVPVEQTKPPKVAENPTKPQSPIRHEIGHRLLKKLKHPFFPIPFEFVFIRGYS